MAEENQLRTELRRRDDEVAELFAKALSIDQRTEALGTEISQLEVLLAKKRTMLQELKTEKISFRALLEANVSTVEVRLLLCCATALTVLFRRLCD